MSAESLAQGSAQEFDWATFWAATAAVVGTLALVGVVVAVISYFKQFPKRRLEYVVSYQRLVTGVLPKGSVLRVEIEGVEVSDPYLVSILFESNSRADISSVAFDGGRPIKVRMEPGGALVLNQHEAQAAAISVSGGHGEGLDWAEFAIEPQLIRKKARGQLIFVSDGPPHVSIESPLVDIEVREFDTESSMRLRATMIGFLRDFANSVATARLP